MISGLIFLIQYQGSVLPMVTADLANASNILDLCALLALRYLSLIVLRLAIFSGLTIIMLPGMVT